MGIKNFVSNHWMSVYKTIIGNGNRFLLITTILMISQVYSTTACAGRIPKTPASGAPSFPNHIASMSVHVMVTGATFLTDFKFNQYVIVTVAGVPKSTSLYNTNYLSGIEFQYTDEYEMVWHNVVEENLMISLEAHNDGFVADTIYGSINISGLKTLHSGSGSGIDDVEPLHILMTGGLEESVVHLRAVVRCRLQECDQRQLPSCGSSLEAPGSCMADTTRGVCYKGIGARQQEKEIDWPCGDETEECYQDIGGGENGRYSCTESCSGRHYIENDETGRCKLKACGDRTPESLAGSWDCGVDGETDGCFLSETSTCVRSCGPNSVKNITTGECELRVPCADSHHQVAGVGAECALLACDQRTPNNSLTWRCGDSTEGVRCFENIGRNIANPFSEETECALACSGIHYTKDNTLAGTTGKCQLMECASRTPVIGKEDWACAAEEDGTDERCYVDVGYRADKCVLACTNPHYTTTTAGGLDVVGGDNPEETGRCTMLVCNHRTPVASGNWPCGVSGETVRCFEDMHFNGPGDGAAVISSNTCAMRCSTPLQFKHDSAEAIETGKCTPIPCLERSPDFYVISATWYCASPMDTADTRCFLNLGAANPYVCVHTCTNPHFESTSTEFPDGTAALQTGMCTIIPCDQRVPTGEDGENWKSCWANGEPIGCFDNIGRREGDTGCALECSNPFYTNKNAVALSSGACTLVPCSDRRPVNFGVNWPCAANVYTSSTPSDTCYQDVGSANEERCTTKCTNRRYKSDVITGKCTLFMACEDRTPESLRNQPDDEPSPPDYVERMDVHVKVTHATFTFLQTGFNHVQITVGAFSRNTTFANNQSLDGLEWPYEEPEMIFNDITEADLNITFHAYVQVGMYDLGVAYLDASSLKVLPPTTAEEVEEITLETELLATLRVKVAVVCTLQLCDMRHPTFDDETKRQGTCASSLEPVRREGNEEEEATPSMPACLLSGVVCYLEGSVDGEVDWPCGKPEEQCYQDVGGTGGRYVCTKQCTGPHYDNISGQAAETGKCTLQPCTERIPIAGTERWKCGQLSENPRCFQDSDSNGVTDTCVRDCSNTAHYERTSTTALETGVCTEKLCAARVNNGSMNVPCGTGDCFADLTENNPSISSGSSDDDNSSSSSTKCVESQCANPYHYHPDPSTRTCVLMQCSARKPNGSLTWRCGLGRSEDPLCFVDAGGTGCVVSCTNSAQYQNTTEDALENGMCMEKPCDDRLPNPFSSEPCGSGACYMDDELKLCWSTCLNPYKNSLDIEKKTCKRRLSYLFIPVYLFIPLVCVLICVGFDIKKSCGFY